MSTTAPPQPASVVWHDAECGGYAADLAVWQRLASERGGPVVDLGAGTGRVALHLAARGHEVIAVDTEPELLSALADRADARSLLIETLVADARELDLGGTSSPLVIAPMQLAHLLGGAEGRAQFLAAVAANLEPGGALALAVLLEPLPPSGTPDPLPDVREVNGWLHSSLPLAVRVGAEDVELDRLRQVVAPDGELTEEQVTTHLDRLPPALLERELLAAGFEIVASEPIAETPEHVGSLLIVAERSSDV